MPWSNSMRGGREAQADGLEAGSWDPQLASPGTKQTRETSVAKTKPLKRQG